MSTPSHPAATPSAEPERSPPWDENTKRAVVLFALALLVGLLVYFRAYIGPITLAFVLAYTLHPLAAWIDRHTPFSWRASVGLLYLMLVTLLTGLLALGGLALVQQVQTLYAIAQRLLLVSLPTWLSQLSTRVYTIGLFKLDFTRLDLNAFSQQMLSALQPLLSQVGGLVSNLAVRTLSLLGWLAFVLLLSYFLLVESGRVSATFFRIDVPQYGDDLRRMGEHLGRIWNAFLRGQVVIAMTVFLLNWAGLSLFGVRNALVLALLSALARFVPYLGPLLVYVTAGAMVFFQPTHLWNLSAWRHVALVIVYLMLLDQVFDNYIVPRVMGEVLGVHPAAVLVAALVLARLLGVIGLLLAAPIVASLRLFVHYVLAKLGDKDPWEELPLAPLTVWPLPSWLKRWLHRRPHPPASGG